MTLAKLESLCAKESPEWGRHLVRSARRLMRDGVDESKATSMAVQQVEQEAQERLQSLNQEG